MEGTRILDLIIVVAFSALICGLAAEDTLLSRLLSTDVMLLGEGISYSLYLMQQLVKDLAKTIADLMHIDSGALRMGLMTIILFAISLIHDNRKASRASLLIVYFDVP